VLDGSGHTDDMGVDGDHVANKDADLACVDDANIGRKNDWDYEVVPFNAASDESLRAVMKQKRFGGMWIWRGRRRREGKDNSRVTLGCKVVIKVASCTR
jgi:hypothetical protein